MKKQLIFLFPIILMMACSPINSGQKNIRFLINAGINSGGITENTDLILINITEADAISGATDVGYHFGGHCQVPLKNNALQAGVEFMHNEQIMHFNNSLFPQQSVRNFNVNQWMLPLSYIFVVGGSHKTGGYLQIKAGPVLQYNIVSIKDNQPYLPSYSINALSGGLHFGIQSNIFNFSNGISLGLSVDAYRGSRIYTDIFNPVTIDTPGSSYLKGGIIITIPSGY